MGTQQQHGHVPDNGHVGRRSAYKKLAHKQRALALAKRYFIHAQILILRSHILRLLSFYRCDTLGESTILWNRLRPFTVFVALFCAHTAVDDGLKWPPIPDHKPDANVINDTGLKTDMLNPGSRHTRSAMWTEL